VVIHGGHPECANGRSLGFLLLLALPRLFEDDIERITIPMPIIDSDEEVGVIT